MNKAILRIFILTILLFAAAVCVNSQTISGTITGGAVTRGSTAHGTVTMVIPGGLHVNSNRPSSEYAIATKVRLSGTGVKMGSVNYPRGTNRKFEFSENAINVYEGTVHFPFSLTVPAGFSGNAVKLRAVVHYQACTNEVCYPPKDKEITITAKVR
jgi:DsbC/DsbD-like thiol-disulfide interchange protein